MLNGLRVKHFPFVLWTLLIASTSSDKMSGTPSDRNFLAKFIKTYIESNQLINDKLKLRTEEVVISAEVENAIRLKVNELKPLLQDTEHNDYTKIDKNNNLNSKKLEGNNNTTLSEVVPENNRRADTKSVSRETKQLIDTFKEKVENYEQLRENITTLLDKVINGSTSKKLITRTLDEMLDTLIERQCKWKSVGTVMQELTEKALASQNSGKPLRGVEFLGRNHDGRPPESVDDLQRSYSKLLLSTWDVLDKYKSRCYLSRQENPDGEAEPRPVYRSHIQTSDNTFDRYDNGIKNENQCNSFIICSHELSDFLKITYSYLNDTVLGTFRSYADNYNNTESVKDIVNSVLINLSKSAEIKLKQVFVNELGHLTLDENRNKKANIQHINDFISVTTGQIKSNLSRFVGDKLNAPQIELFSKIKDDLIFNLRMDIDNCRQRLADKICGFFVLCNRINPYGTRRMNKPRAFSPENTDKVYVKVQLSFDDELKDSLVRFGEKTLNSIGEKSDRVGKSLIDAIDRRKYSYVNRTTISSTATTDGILSNENGLADQFF